jgi:hypothetical protein
MRSKASHTFLLIELGFIKIVIEATFGGVKLTPYEKWKKHSKLTHLFALGTKRPEAMVNAALSEAFSTIGTKYDYAGYFGFLPLYILRWFGKKIRNPFGSARAMACSEFVVQVREELQIRSWMHFDPESTSPQDIIDVCEKSDEFVSVPFPK